MDYINNLPRRNLSVDITHFHLDDIYDTLFVNENACGIGCNIGTGLRVSV